MPYTTDDLIQHYNCGDLNSIIFNHDTAQVPNLVNTSLPPSDLRRAQTIDDYFRDELIDKRNQRMTERVIHLLQKYPQKSFFFAFGAGHYLGNNTVIDRMREAGFDVQHTSPDYIIPDIEVKSSQSSPRLKKNYFSHMKPDFPQASDVIYGDARYLLNKQYNADLTLRERKRLLRAKKRQQQLTQLWNSLEADSFSEIRRNSKKKKKSRNRKTFNDLWVRMEDDGANIMAPVGERNQEYHRTTVSQIVYSYYHGGQTTQHNSSFTLIFVAAILMVWTNMSIQ